MTDSPAAETPDPIAEGARARTHGRPKDACPYPAESRERVEWLEGYDGIPAARVPDAS
ncbi:Rmf/CrpP family protein [Methylobacterium komagatae]|uniref:Rmf/CrpP family protein n=1 Tax=Methylobacterium komagatae TaxID=374425 RepID=A0ABW2BQA7_9HYPH